ncbi:hypothetical protein GCM10022210_31560 [Mucilaginibacter dorajii]|uniref:Uncharacterized protein n=1 Tax=Mucilaginibacter dorajii TaxID=692994 RepID=A0ABP7Q8Z9_9SPHI
MTGLSWNELRSNSIALPNRSVGQRDYRATLAMTSVFKLHITKQATHDGIPVACFKKVETNKKELIK